MGPPRERGTAPDYRAGSEDESSLISHGTEGSSQPAAAAGVKRGPQGRQAQERGRKRDSGDLEAPPAARRRRLVAAVESGGHGGGGELHCRVQHPCCPSAEPALHPSETRRKTTRLSQRMKTRGWQTQIF